MTRWLLNRWRERFYRGPTQVELTCPVRTYMGVACRSCWQPHGSHAEGCEERWPLSFEEMVMDFAAVFEVDPALIAEGPLFAP